MAEPHTWSIPGRQPSPEKAGAWLLVYHTLGGVHCQPAVWLTAALVNESQDVLFTAYNLELPWIGSKGNKSF